MIHIDLEIYNAQTAFDDIRDARGGGNVITSLLCCALERRLIEEALVVRMSEEIPYKGVSTVVKTREEILASRGSKYAYIRQRHLSKRLSPRNAVVGLPCQIKKCPSNLLKLGLFCGLNYHPHILDLIFKKHKIDKGDISYMDYRSPGSFRLLIGLKNGERFESQGLPGQESIHIHRTNLPHN